jgi:hypothetical protein
VAGTKSVRNKLACYPICFIYLAIPITSYISSRSIHPT